MALFVSTDIPPKDPVLTPHTAYYIPEHYIVQHQQKTENSQIDRWKNEQKFIKLYQSTTQTDVFSDNDGAETFTTVVGNLQVRHYVKKDICTIYWENDNIFFTLTCPSSLEWAEIEKIILNIQPTKE
jgi:hypothetical protein